MKSRASLTVVALLASTMFLTACVSPISAENASAEINVDRQIALTGQDFRLDINIDVAEQNSDTPYRLEVLGITGSGERTELLGEDGAGSVVREVQISFPTSGLWQTEVRLIQPQSGDVLISASGPEIEVFEEASLSIQPAKSYDTWITGEPMPLAPSISPSRLLQSLTWNAEILRGDEWRVLSSVDSESPQLPAFEEEDEALQSLRLVAYAGDDLFATSQPFELRVATPSTLIRQVWDRENKMADPEELWEEISSTTYPGIQFPSDEDRAFVIQVYKDYGMPRTSVLSETLAKVPELDLEIEYNKRPCSDPEVIKNGIEGTHFAYDVVWYGNQLLFYSTFWEGKMYQHRTLCYD